MTPALTAYLRAVEEDMQPGPARTPLVHLPTLVRLVRDAHAALEKIQHHCEVAATHSAIYSVAETALARAEGIVKEGTHET